MLTLALAAAATTVTWVGLRCASRLPAERAVLSRLLDLDTPLPGEAPPAGAARLDVAA